MKAASDSIRFGQAQSQQEKSREIRQQLIADWKGSREHEV